MTTFTVTFHNGSEQTFTGSFSYDASAVLRVNSDDGKRTHFAPHAWLTVTDDAPDTDSTDQ